jgi:membrane protein YdbS with pleckstrin-like domain
VVCVALIPLGTEVDAVVALGLAAVVTSMVIAYETVRYAEARHRVREQHAGGA